MKSQLRKELLLRRDSLKEEERERKSQMIKERLFLLPEFQAATFILFYVAFKSEVKTEGIIKEAIHSGKRVALPVVDRKGKRLLISELKDFDLELSAGYLGIPEHKERFFRPTALNALDIAIIPGIGFDGRGFRLGYGGGFYDRLLSEAVSKISSIGLAYEIQIVPEIPGGPHDIRVDKIITEDRVIITRQDGC